MREFTGQTQQSMSAPLEEEQIDPKNPFENAMEDRDYRTDYRQIVPQIMHPSFRLPLFPEQEERRAIRKRINVAGFGVFFGELLLQVLFTIMVYMILMLLGASTDYEAAYNYFYNSSLLIVLNALLFTGINTAVALLGCRSVKIPARSLFQTKNLKAGTLLQYMTIGVGIQMVAGMVYLIIDFFASQNGVDLVESDMSYFQTTKSTVVLLLYTCILAPVTEELLYRGFLMKTLSVVSVRFGIVVSAILFGLGHGNISQFLLGFLLGMFMGKIDVRHNSIVPSICVHVTINSVSMLLSLVQEVVDGVVGNGILLLLSMLYYAVGILGLIFWFWKERQKPLPYPTQKQAARMRVCWLSPGLLVAFGLLIGLLILNQVTS